MKLIYLTLLFIALCLSPSCSKEENNTAADEPRPSNVAVNAAKPVPQIERPSFPLKEYWAMKQAFLEVYGYEDGEHERPPKYEPVEITACDFAGEHIAGYRPSLTREPMPLFNLDNGSFEPSGNMYLMLANDLAYAAMIFEYYQIPKTLWQDRLDKIEQVGLEWLATNKIDQTMGKDSPKFDQFRTLLEREISTLASKVTKEYGDSEVKFSTNFECGGTGWAEFQLKADQGINKILLLTRWNAIVCSKSGIDHFDTTKCRGWRPVSVPTTEIAGDMYYTAVWNNGHKSQGSIIFHNRSKGTYAVTIRNSGAGFEKIPEESLFHF